MDRTERFYRIDQILNERRFATFIQLQEALDVSRATLTRDLQYLRERLNAPIIFDRDAGGYRFDTPDRYAPRYELPGLWFNASEIHALLTMQHLLEEVQPGLLGPHIAPLLARLKSLLGSRDDAPEEVADRIRILHAAKRRMDLCYFEVLASALLNRKRLLLRHFNRKSGEESEREVSPQRLVYYRDNWYLDAWCHLRKDIRSFAVDAIRHASIVDKKAKSVPARELDAVLGAGYGIFGGSKVQWATLRFTPERARWVAAEEWHPQQKTSFEADGSYVMEIPYSADTELLMDILRHIPEVQVLKPEALRQRLMATLEAGLATIRDSGNSG
jgi:predicted DNA-binding transcriptional regulator YafY